MTSGKLHVVLYTVPLNKCDSNQGAWSDVANLLKNQLTAEFGERIIFEHIEFLSQAWFHNQIPQDLLKNGHVNFPFVTVNDEVACADKKVNISKIKKLIHSKLKG